MEGVLAKLEEKRIMEYIDTAALNMTISIFQLFPNNV